MSYNQKELQMGIKVEMEHTKDPNLAEKIAMDHLREDPKYYTKLNNAGLADELGGEVDEHCGVPGCGYSEEQPLEAPLTKTVQIAVIGKKESGEAQPSKPLTSSNLGVGGVPRPLTSTTLQAPKGQNSISGLGKTPPKMSGKDITLGDSTGEGVPVQDEEGNQKPNSVRVNQTPNVGCKADATDFFAGQISKALQSEFPRKMAVIPAQIYEGGSQLKKKVNNYDGVKVDDAHAGITTDMKGDDRWTIQAFDTKKANKKETPHISESHHRHNQSELRRSALLVAHFLRAASPAELAEFVEAERSGDLIAAVKVLSSVLSRPHGHLKKTEPHNIPFSSREEPLVEYVIAGDEHKYTPILGANGETVYICAWCDKERKITDFYNRKNIETSHGLCRRHFNELMKDSGIKESMNLKELIFHNNAGVMEVFKFFERATNDEKTQFDSLINSGQDQAAWNLIEKVLQTRFQGEGPWRPGITA